MITGQARIVYRDFMDAYLNDWKNYEFILIVAISIGLAAGASQIDNGIGVMFKFFISPIAIIMAGAIIYHAVLFYRVFQKLPDDKKFVSMSVDHAGITLKDESGKGAQIPWQAYTDILSRPRGWVLRQPEDCRSQWVVRRTFDPETGARFEALAREKISGKLNQRRP